MQRSSSWWNYKYISQKILRSEGTDMVFSVIRPQSNIEILSIQKNDKSCQGWYIVREKTPTTVESLTIRLHLEPL